MIRVTVWNEYVQEPESEEIRKIYPHGIHKAIADFLSQEEDFSVKYTTLSDKDCGLSQNTLNNTDVLVWWSHIANEKLTDDAAKRVHEAVLRGMGIIFLHSSHQSKPFKMLVGTNCDLSWRENEDLERIWIVNQSHPITQGLGKYFEIEHEEVYSEPFAIPQPDTLLMIGWFEGGEVFRSGCCFERGAGKIFYFQPGHETFPTFYNQNIQKIIKNAVRWANPTFRINELKSENKERIK